MKLEPANAQEFTTTPSGSDEAPGGYLGEMSQKCGYTVPKDQWETIYKFETKAKDGGGDLLGDTPVELAAVGSSFTGGPWNFTGFLSEDLQRDVHNYGVPGGGVFTSLETYVHGAYKEEKPKVLVWEIFTGNLLSILSGVPAVAQEIQGASLLVRGELTSCTTPVALEAIGSPGTFKVPGEVDTVLNVGFQDLAVRSFNITLAKANQKTATLSIQRITRVQNDGKYSVMLPASELHAASSISIGGVDTGKIKKITACR